ncbi:MAG: hypothetical protein J5693_06340 [Bacteroidales bacterium]|nr:hypothetical protein [Bacteroidales bacterium]
MGRFIAEHPLAAVFAFVTVCVLPMMIWRDPSPSNELRYLSIVEEALRDGHFFCFYNQSVPYTDKPPLFFWLLMFFRLFCGETCMWLPVLFTALIPSFVTVAVMDRWLLLACGPQAAVSERTLSPLSSRPEQPPLSSQPSEASGGISRSGLLPPHKSFAPCRSVVPPSLAPVANPFMPPATVSPSLSATPLQRILAASTLLAGLLVMIQTFFLRMDMLMTMFIVLALFTFWKMYTGSSVRKADRWRLPAYIFLALFTKGPVGFFAPVLIIIVFLAIEKQLRRLPEFLGWRQWLVMLALFGGWILGAYLEGGREYVGSLLFHQTMDRAVNAFTHKQPFWWYIPTLLYAILPYTLLIIPALIYLYRRQWRDNSYVRLLLTAIAVVFVMLSAFSGKLAIYLTPIMPFMAYLLPVFGNLTSGKGDTLKKTALLVPAAIFALAGIGLWALSLSTGTDPLAQMAMRLAMTTPYIFCPTIRAIAAVLAAGSIIAIIIICKSGWQRGAIALGAALYIAVFAAGCTIEPLNEWTAYEKVCREAAGATDTGTCNTLFVHRPENMDIYLGGDVTDFGEDVQTFVSTSHRGEALIIDWHRAGSQPALLEHLESLEGTQVGPFTVYAL